ncbi:MAG: DinB family protein [Chryseobacterium sp.]|nr:MAG: DinB family protein [Chryseobacterium sp.]
MTDVRFQCEILRASRKRLSDVLEITDPEILFKIPQGHCITSQQRHMYMRSGLPMQISREFEAALKIGSSPRTWEMIPDVNKLKFLLTHTVDQLELDLESGLFVNYEPFNLPLGFQVNNHIEALQAAIYHEAEHSGVILMFLKLLGSKS